MMNDWYQRMVDTLQLNGKGERTQQAYTRSVRMLSQFYEQNPRSGLGAGTPRLLPPAQKRQSLVPQNHAHLLLRDTLLLRERPPAQLAHSLASCAPKMNDAFPPS